MKLLPVNPRMRLALVYLWLGLVVCPTSIVVAFVVPGAGFVAVPSSMAIVMFLLEAWYAYSAAFDYEVVAEEYEPTTNSQPTPTTPTSQPPGLSKSQYESRRRLYEFVTAAWAAPQLGPKASKGAGFTDQEYRDFVSQLQGWGLVTSPPRGGSPKRLVQDVREALALICQRQKDPNFWTAVGLNAASPPLSAYNTWKKVPRVSSIEEEEEVEEGDFSLAM